MTATDDSCNKGGITITNDMDRPSKEDIDRMVEEAQRFRIEGEKQRARASAKNAIEGYCFKLKEAVKNSKDKMSDADKQTIIA